MIRRDVVGRRPEGETIPSGLRPDEDNEVTKVGHILRNSTGTPSQCHDTRAKPLWNAVPC